VARTKRRHRRTGAVVLQPWLQLGASHVVLRWPRRNHERRRRDGIRFARGAVECNDAARRAWAVASGNAVWDERVLRGAELRFVGEYELSHTHDQRDSWAGHDRFQIGAEADSDFVAAA